MNKFSSLKYILHSLIVEAKHVASGLASDHHLAVLGKIGEGGCELHLLVMLPLGLHVCGSCRSVHWFALRCVFWLR